MVVDPYQNTLLQRLDPADFSELKQHCQPVSLEFRQQLYDHRQHLTYVHFPLTGVVALMRVLTDGRTVEVASVGNEGVIGYGALIDSPIVSGHAVVQVPGEALRIEAAAIKRFALEHPKFRTVAMNYGHALISHLMQSVLCNQFHGPRQRYARWLLHTHDRAGRDTYPITQEVAAQMIGVRRATVSEVAGEFSRAGAVRSRRGLLTILDRSRLMAFSCECYSAVQEEYKRLLGVPES